MGYMCVRSNRECDGCMECQNSKSHDYLEFEHKVGQSEFDEEAEEEE